MRERTEGRRQKGVVRLALVYAALLASLSLVVWRQSRTLDELRALDELRRERAVLEATRAEQVRGLEHLESRGHVVDYASRELGMHIPAADEIVLLPWPAQETAEGADGEGSAASPRPSRRAGRSERTEPAEGAG